VARLARSTIRPLVLPIVSGPTSHKPARGHGTSSSQPRGSSLKSVYDVVGTVCTILVVNFACTPFILLHLPDGVEAWRRLQWYGLWMIFGGIAFFYCGGAAWLKGLQVKRMRQVDVATISANGRSTPSTLPTVPPLDAAFRGVEKKLS
jgi:lysophospholipid acyltransferase